MVGQCDCTLKRTVLLTGSVGNLGPGTRTSSAVLPTLSTAQSTAYSQMTSDTRNPSMKLFSVVVVNTKTVD